MIPDWKIALITAENYLAEVRQAVNAKDMARAVRCAWTAEANARRLAEALEALRTEQAKARRAK
jgi:hypothetical protein